MRHDELLKKRGDLAADFQKQDADLDARLRLLQADEDYRKFLRAEAVAKEIAEIETERRESVVANNQELRAIVSQIEAAADPAIYEFIQWCYDEKLRTQKAISNRGILEADRLGNKIGYLLTNEKKINARTAALDLARASAQALKVGPQSDIAGDLEKLQRSIPRFDVQEERITVDAGFAAAVS